MKKLMIALAFVSMSAATFAQEVTEIPTLKYSVATNSFWSNWFITVQGTYSNYLDGGADNGILQTPMWGGSIALGKWFTPGLGLRLKANGLQYRNNNFGGGDNHKKTVVGTLDVMFNLSNIFCGYSETRVWNLVPYVAAGGAFTKHTKSPLLGVGVISTWKLGKHVNFNIEGSYKALNGSYAGINGKHDAIFALEGGLTFNLGKSTWNKVPDVDAIMAANQAQLDALNAALAAAQAENAELKNKLANQPVKKEVVTKEVTKLAAVPASVFFNIGRSKIASKKDLVNVEALADYAKANNSTIVVTGYADSATGSAEFNQTLSEKRAKTVADALVEMGVSADKIVTKANGGVDTLSPASYNRRATVEVK